MGWHSGSPIEVAISARNDQPSSDMPWNPCALRQGPANGNGQHLWDKYNVVNTEWRATRSLRLDPFWGHGRGQGNVSPHETKLMVTSESKTTAKTRMELH
jgi:hypothetical protein